MTMHLEFGEGTGTVVHDGRIYLQFDHKGEGFVVALNAADGKELWRAPRMGFELSTPLVVEHAGASIWWCAPTPSQAYDVET